MKYYFLMIWGDVEPELFGPYDDGDIRDGEARAKAMKSDEDGVYWVDQEDGKDLKVGGYSGHVMDRETVGRINKDLKLGSLVTIFPLKNSLDTGVFNAQVIALHGSVGVTPEVEDTAVFQRRQYEVKYIRVSESDEDIDVSRLVFPAFDLNTYTPLEEEKSGA